MPSDPDLTPSKSIWGFSVLLLVTFLVFWPALKIPFYYDDFSFIVWNPSIKDLSRWLSYFTDGGSLSSAGSFWIWRPLRTLSYALDYSIWKLNPVGYHAIGLLLHLGTGFLVCLWAKVLLKNMRAAWLTAALFLVHPVQTQTVAWVSCRGDLLFAFFGMGYILLGLRAARDKSGKTVFPFLAGSYACLVFALFAKETAIMLPLGLWACLLYSRQELPGRLQKSPGQLRRLAPSAVLIFFYLVWRTSVLGQLAQPEFAQGASGPSISPFVLGRYVGLALIPWPLKLEYPPQVSVGNPEWWSGLAVTLLLLGALWACRKKHPAISLGLGWFLIFLLPVLHLLPFHGLMSEHQLYLSMAGLALAIAPSLERLLKRRSGIICIVLLFSIFVGLIHERLQQWQDPLSFWHREMRLSPQSYRVALHLGNSYHQIGRPERAKHYYLKSKELNPTDNDVTLNLAHLAVQQQDYLLAARYTDEVLARESENPDAIALLGTLAVTKGSWEQAVLHYRRAIALRPKDAKFHHDLGLVLGHSGALEEALVTFQQAVKLNPDSAADWNNLGVSYANLGRSAEAREAWEHSVDLDPLSQGAKQNLQSLEKGPSSEPESP
ncbi:MAG: tetratricopeptide repeat protein [Candidatus Omnitrophica bacterium]|nr:tetratricopeptide repeat protein [Candidatus Omnitrophota bacterium]